MIPVVKRCNVFGCDRPVVANGICDLHYRRLKRHGHVDQTRPKDWGARSAHPVYGYWKQIRRNGSPICAAWNDDFWVFVRDVGDRPSVLHFLYRPDKDQPLGPDNAIWSVSKAGDARDSDHTEKRRAKREYMAAYMKERRVSDPLFQHRIGLATVHGITPEDYDRLADAQGDFCAICGRKDPRFHTHAGRRFRLAVDHRHGSTEIRGLLCHPCNSAVGMLDDSPALLQRAMDYLRNPPAAALGLLHSGKFKQKRREREPSPYAGGDPQSRAAAA